METNIHISEELISNLVFELSRHFPQFGCDIPRQQKLKQHIEKVIYSYNLSGSAKKDTSLQVGTHSFMQCIQFYVQCKKLEGMSEKTLRNYVQELLRFSDFVGKDPRLVTKADVRMYISHAQSRIKASSVNTKIYDIKSFFSWMYGEGIIESNPTLNVKSIKTPKKVVTPLTDTEVELIKLSCNTPREKAIIETLHATGIRVSEICDIKLEDIDWEHLIILVRGKGNKEREVCFDIKAKILMCQYLEQRLGDSEYLFCGSRYPFNKLGARAIQKEVRTVSQRAGVSSEDNRVFPHRFRHTFATQRLNSGMSISSVQFLLGHEEPATTQRYTQITKNTVIGEYQRTSN